MTLANIIMGIGIILILFSFFLKDRTKKIEKDVEELSISIYQETNNLKRRLKVVEEELLLDVPPIKMNKQQVPQPSVTSLNSKSVKPVHSIIVNQVLELGKQGMSVHEIQKRSALSAEQVTHILKNGGM